MRTNLRKISWIDLTLAIIVIGGIAITVVLWQGNNNSTQRLAKLEARSRVTELNLSEAEKTANLDSLRQNLERLQKSLSENPFSSQAEAIEVTYRIMASAEKNNVTVTSWSTTATSVSLEGKTYPAFAYILTTESRLNSLVNFFETLTQASVAPVLRRVQLAEIEGRQGTWQMQSELVVYYR